MGKDKKSIKLTESQFKNCMKISLKEDELKQGYNPEKYKDEWGEYMEKGDPVWDALDNIGQQIGCGVERNDDDPYLFEMSSNGLMMSYWFKADKFGNISLIKIDDMDKFKKTYNEISILNRFFKNGPISIHNNG